MGPPYSKKRESPPKWALPRLTRRLVKHVLNHDVLDRAERGLTFAVSDGHVRHHPFSKPCEGGITEEVLQVFQGD